MPPFQACHAQELGVDIVYEVVRVCRPKVYARRRRAKLRGLRKAVQEPEFSELRTRARATTHGEKNTARSSTRSPLKQGHMTSSDSSERKLGLYCVLG